MGILDFFSPEAGQERRQWLNRQEDTVENALRGYLGPAANPIMSAAQIAGLLSPGADLMEGAQYSRDVWNADSAMDAATAGAGLLGATAMMALPGNYNALSEGFGSVVDDMVRAYDPTMMRAGFGAASETPAQQVARMLAEGRAAEVTDDMMARVDPQEMWRLYEAGATGAEMPMDLASRMSRAQDMGLVDDQYHVTLADFPAFRPSDVGLAGRGVYTGDDAQDVQSYVLSRTDNDAGYNAIPLRTPNASEYARNIDWQRTLDADPDLPYNATLEQNIAGMKRAADNMEARGFAGVNSQPGERVTFNPSRLRSQFARFDPRLSHLANLSAGIGGVGIGLNALALPPQEDQDRQALLDWLNSQGL
jgi:hypothetical protein